MRSLALPVLVASLLTTAIDAQTFTFPAIADATTDDSQPTVNFGSSPRLDFGKQFVSSPFQVWFARGHVRFDLSGFVGAGLVPVRATFFWYQSQSSAAGCLDVSVHRVIAPWSESTITWANQPPHDPTEISRTCVGNSFDLGWKEFDVTTLAQDWVTAIAPNDGLVIRDPSESTAGAARPGLGHSRENGDPTLVPYLEIEFAEQFGTGCTSHSLVPLLAVQSGTSTMGETLVLRTKNLVPTSNVVMFFGLDNTQWNGLPLPFDLTQLGFPNCNVLVELALQANLPTAPSTFVDLAIAVPNVPALDGVSLYAQTFAAPPQSSLIEASNGLGFPMRL